LIDEEGEGNAYYYAAEEKEQHLTCVWFMELDYNFGFFHCFAPRFSVVGGWQKLGC
jgi:hypothetical protein